MTLAELHAMKKQQKTSQTNGIGTQGWQEFLVSKKELLDKYEAAKSRSINRPVRTEHGNVAEAAYREWLSEFLPGRYAVTSGYIISAGYSSRTKLKHFDVIIYDRLESPVLWHSNNPDSSPSGRERAIPVEYVLHVAEVKAKLTKKSVNEAAKKLDELSPLLSGVNSDTPFGAVYLPNHFTCSIVFFEVDEKTQEKHDDLLQLVRPGMRGYCGGIILKSPDGNVFKTAKIFPTRSKKHMKPSESPRSPYDPHVRLGGYWIWSGFSFNDEYYGVQWDWQENHFIDFMYGLIRMLSGDYSVGAFSWYVRYFPGSDSPNYQGIPSPLES